MHTLDTNAIIYYLKDDAHAVFELNRIFASGKPIYVSAITEIELFGFPNLTAKEENNPSRNPCRILERGRSQF